MDRTMYGKVLPGTYYPFRCAMKENGISPGYALLADLQNSINPGARVNSPGGRTSSPGGRTSSPGGRTGSPGGRTHSPGGRATSPGGSLSSPSSTGYGSINGSRNHSSDYQKPSSPTYQNSGSLNEKVVPVRHYGSQSGGYGAHQGGGGGGGGGGGANHGYGANQTGSYGRAGAGARATSGGGGGGGGLSELDSLLNDLSNARYAGYSDRPASYDRTDGYGRTNGAASPGGAASRPSVDSLLDQLSTEHHNGGGGAVSPVTARTPPAPGTRQVTVTVQETVVEPAHAQPPPPLHHPHHHHPTHSLPHPPHHHHQHQHHQQQHVSTSATRELDDLMASLSDFKVSQAHSPGEGQQQVYRERHAWQEHYHSTSAPPAAAAAAPPPAPHAALAAEPASLERMLGSLRADMSRQGVQTPQKGCCNACDKPIVGQVITALGRTWHPEHFTCAHCTQELGTRNFFERDGKPYCEPDYHNLFSPRCAYCNGPILDKCVTALEKTWHTEHFFCAQCGQQFGEDGFHERDGKPYCRSDYFDMFAPKCGGCARPIMENYISALNSQWHPDCFVCRECREPFHGGSFFDHEGQPYCETHYHGRRGSLCAGCHKPIAGRCITAMFRKFHPEHFVCAFCLKQLNKGTFKEQNDKPYCHLCFEKLFG